MQITRGPLRGIILGRKLVELISTDGVGEARFLLGIVTSARVDPAFFFAF